MRCETYIFSLYFVIDVVFLNCLQWTRIPFKIKGNKSPSKYYWSAMSEKWQVRSYDGFCRRTCEIFRLVGCKMSFSSWPFRLLAVFPWIGCSLLPSSGVPQPPLTLKLFQYCLWGMFSSMIFSWWPWSSERSVGFFRWRIFCSILIIDIFTKFLILWIHGSNKWHKTL